MDVVRLKATDYDEWLHILNTVFTKQNCRETDFEKALPKMCVRDDEHMGRHLAIKEGGKICALLGVYPLKAKVGGKDIMFSTVGNVATLPECEGRGYMRILMQEAMAELERIGADASRLGGIRQRYQHYGYEPSGTEYKFTIDNFTTKYCFDKKTEVIFNEITLGDEKALQFISNLRQREPIFVQRSLDMGLRGEYMALCAWQNKAFVALGNSGEMIGYMSVSPDGKTVAEAAGVNFEALKAMLFSWQIKIGEGVSFTIGAAKQEEKEYFYENAAGMSLSNPCNFKIINFDKVADAFLGLRATLTNPPPEGEHIIQIKDWGNLRIWCKDGEAHCEKTSMTPHITMNRFTASRCLFGPFSCEAAGLKDDFLSSILPLPLSWSKLDSV